MTNKSPKVCIFQLTVPQYRLGFFEELNRRLGGNLTVCASQDIHEGYELGESSKVGFRLLNFWMAVWRVPFTGLKIYYQPHVLVCVFLRKWDFIVMMNQVTRLDTWVNLLLGRLLGKRVYLWGHGISIRDSAVTVKLRKIIMRLARGNILHSEPGRDKVVEAGLASEKLFVAYNALDTLKAKAAREAITSGDLQRFREENNLLGRRIVLFSGRLQERKKPEVLVRAKCEMKCHAPDVLAIIIGDGPARAEVERLIREHKLEDSLRVLGAVFDEEVLARYLLCSSVAVMPAVGWRNAWIDCLIAACRIRRIVDSEIIYCVIATRFLHFFINRTLRPPIGSPNRRFVQQ